MPIQNPQKVIEKATVFNSPIEIAEIKVGQKSIEAGTNFDCDDNWLAAISLNVKNISSKAIVYLSINLNFPETRSTGNMMSYPFVFGQQPNSKFPQKRDPILFLPSHFLEIRSESHYAELKAFIQERQRVEDISRAQLEIGFVIFADNTAWSAGNFLRQDPYNPDHYINVGNTPPDSH